MRCYWWRSLTGSSSIGNVGRRNVYQSANYNYNLPVCDRREKWCPLPSLTPSSFLLFSVASNNFKTGQKLQIWGKDKAVWPEFHQSKFPRNQGLGLLLALCEWEGEGWWEAIWRSSGKWSEAGEDQGCSLCKFANRPEFTWSLLCSAAYHLAAIKTTVSNMSRSLNLYIIFQR